LWLRVAFVGEFRDQQASRPLREKRAGAWTMANPRADQKTIHVTDAQATIAWQHRHTSVPPFRRTWAVDAGIGRAPHTPLARRASGRRNPSSIQHPDSCSSLAIPPLDNTPRRFPPSTAVNCNLRHVPRRSPSSLGSLPTPTICARAGQVPRRTPPVTLRPRGPRAEGWEAQCRLSECRHRCSEAGGLDSRLRRGKQHQGCRRGGREGGRC
jgi:hypothetical protein